MRSRAALLALVAVSSLSVCLARFPIKKSLMASLPKALSLDTQQHKPALATYGLAAKGLSSGTAAEGDDPTTGCFAFANNRDIPYPLSVFYEIGDNTTNLMDPAVQDASITCQRLNAYVKTALPDNPTLSGEYSCRFFNSDAYVCGVYGSSDDILSVLEALAAPGPDGVRTFFQGLIETVWPFIGACDTFANILIGPSVDNTVDGVDAYQLLDSDVEFDCKVPKTSFPYCSCYRGGVPPEASLFESRYTYDPTDPEEPYRYVPFENDVIYGTYAKDSNTNAHCFSVIDNNIFDPREQDPTPGTCGGPKEGYQHWTQLKKVEINLKYSMKKYIKGVTNRDGKPLSISWSKDTKTGKWIDSLKITTMSPKGLTVGDTALYCLLVDKRVSMAQVSGSDAGVFFSYFDPTRQCCSKTYSYLLTDYGSRYIGQFM